jgi:hypothetical protein
MSLQTTEGIVAISNVGVRFIKPVLLISLSPRRERVRACPVLDTGVRGNKPKTIFN